MCCNSTYSKVSPIGRIATSKYQRNVKYCQRSYAYIYLLILVLFTLSGFRYTSNSVWPISEMATCIDWHVKLGMSITAIRVCMIDQIVQTCTKTETKI